VGKQLSPIVFTVTTPAYLDNSSSDNICTDSNFPNGIKLSNFTVSGIPTLANTYASTITVTRQGVTPLVIPITFIISSDTFEFTPSNSQSFAFAQNIPITPIQVIATPTYGVPVTFYSGINMPLGLNVSPTGLIQGVPTFSSGSNQFTIAATNGYSTINNTYSYTTVVDSMIVFSSQSNSFQLTQNQMVNISVTTVLRSGATISGGLSSGYLYGLNLTPSLLSGKFAMGTYPDVVVEPNTLITVSSGLSTTFFQLTVANTQTKTNPFGVGSNLYYTTDSFATMNIALSNDTFPKIAIEDIQSDTPGSSNVMATVGSTFTQYSEDGGKTYDFVFTLFGNDFDNPGILKQVAYANSKWYTITTKSRLYYRDGNQWFQTPLSSPSVSLRADGGISLRSVKTPNIFDNKLLYNLPVSSAIGNGSTITYTLPTAPGFPADNNGIFITFSGLFTFSGFTTPELNFVGVPGIMTGPQTITITSPNIGNSSSGFVTFYEYSNVEAPSRLLIGGIGLFYVLETSVFNGMSYTIQTTTEPTTCSLEEVQDFSTNVPTMIIAAGGHRSNDQPSSPYSTLQYSTDYGITWTASANDFTWYAKNVVWGGHVNSNEGTTLVWVAIGYNNNGIPVVKYSTNGTTWVDVNIGVTMTTSTVLGPLQFDGTNWNLMVDGLLYNHDANSATIGLPLFWRGPHTLSPSPTLFCSTPWITGSVSSAATLQIGTTSSGPVFSSPIVTNYIGYQYIPINTIVFDTVLDGTSFFLASTLPAGLAWNPVISTGLTEHTYATISGRPVILGTSIIDVYAQNSLGLSKITVTIVTQPIPIKTPDTTPSGYTNFIKEKVIADSAVSTINNKALVSPVGNFLAIDPRPVTLAPEICCVTTKTIQ
jgi:hypothetical protein